MMRKKQEGREEIRGEERERENRRKCLRASRREESWKGDGCKTKSKGW